ncbi:MAG: Gfo/Idh/MocA family oxidoreductase [Fimbriimonadales bacterium]|nr:Gfo/Idh/MocA family oxidoreductase [Fimbriimonadales bacterium]
MEQITRRTFLERSGRAIVSAAAGLTVLRSWSYSPNDTIGIGIIGLNGQGKTHMRQFSEIEGVRIVALCDVDERVLQQAGAMVEQRTGTRPKLYTDLRQLLEDKAIDAVSTATPNHWHALLTIWACQAGKDVYVEKPACWGFHEGEQMVAAARKYNRIVQVGHQTRSDPITRLAVQRAWAGEIGKIYMARGLCYKPRGPIGFQKDTDPPPWLHWELWQGPANRRPFNPNYVHYNWHWFWNYGNGDIGNQGVHQIDIARWFLNKRYPVKVHSVGGRYGYEDQGETPNTQIATFEYADGTLLVFEVRGLFTNDEQGAKIGNLVYGSLGYMSSGDGYKPRRSPQEELPAKEGIQRPELGGTGEPNHYRNFIQAVRSRRVSDLHCDVEEGVISAQLVHLANISYRLGRALRFDPERKRFIGDREANAMLKRPQQPKGFEIPERV